MLAEQSLDALQKRFEKLVLHHEMNYVSEAHRRGIANRFNKISLQGLLKIVQELDNPQA